MSARSCVSCIFWPLFLAWSHLWPESWLLRLCLPPSDRNCAVMVPMASKDHWVWRHMIVRDTWRGHPFRLISPSCHVCHTTLCFPVFLLGSEEEERTYGRGFFLGCNTQAEGVTYLLWIDLIIMIITETILERSAGQHSCRRGYFERTEDR